MITHRYTFMILFVFAERVSVFYMLMKTTSFPSHFLNFCQAMANPCGGRLRRLASAGISGLAYFNALPQFYTASGSHMGGITAPKSSRAVLRMGHDKQSSFLWVGQQWGRELLAARMPFINGIWAFLLWLLAHYCCYYYQSSYFLPFSLSFLFFCYISYHPRRKLQKTMVYIYLVHCSSL